MKLTDSQIAVAYAAERAGGTPILTYVRLKGRKITATDGYILAEADLEEEVEIDAAGERAVLDLDDPMTEMAYLRMEAKSVIFTPPDARATRDETRGRMACSPSTFSAYGPDTGPRTVLSHSPPGSNTSPPRSCRTVSRALGLTGSVG